MFPRYKLVARLNNTVVYERFFPSINQAVKTALGFDFDSDIYLSIFDELTENIFPHGYVKKLTKEFMYD